MTQLKCSAQTCMFNENHYCCKGDIMVEGRDAKEPSGTCCSSFRERNDQAAKNTVSERDISGPDAVIDVDCQAIQCVFNKDCHCNAERIGIAGSHASQCEDTECASFQCRS